MTKKSYTPNVIETSIGVERLFLAVLLESYTEEELPDKTTRVVLKLKPENRPDIHCCNLSKKQKI